MPGRARPDQARPGPARLLLDCFLCRLIGWLAGWLEGCLHDLLVGRSGSIARGAFPSEVQRRFPVGGGVLEACGSEFKARNSKLEGWTRKDFVVSNHSIVSRSTCEGTRRVHPHARMHPGMPRGVHPVGAPGGCTRRVHPAGAPACPHARMPRGVHPAVPPAGLGFRV